MANPTEIVGEEKGGSKPGDQRLQCVVVTPEKVLLDELVEFVAIPLYDGELGILPGRTPVIGRLGFGELRTRAGGVTSRYFLDGGFAQVRNDVVTILTNRAIPAADLDPAGSAVDLEKLSAKRASSDLEFAEIQKSISRIRGMIRVAGRSQ